MPGSEIPAASQRWLPPSHVMIVALGLFALAAVPLYGEGGPGEWTLKTPLPAIRAEVAAAALDGKLHAVGGALNGVAGTYHDEYDPATDSWRPRAALP
jgi:hypothetical protein